MGKEKKMSFKIEKKQVTRYVLELECTECHIQDSFTIGYDFLNREQARNFVVESKYEWNIFNPEKVLCPECGKRKRYD